MNTSLCVFATYIQEVSSSFVVLKISGSVAKVRDVIVGVASITLGGVVGDPQVVKAREEDQQADDDDGNGAVGMLRAEPYKHQD